MRDDNQHLFFVLCTLASGIIWIVGSSFFNTGWVTATIIAFGVFFLIVFYIANADDPFLVRLLVVSLMAGWMGVCSDWWLIHSCKTLIYYPGGPFVGRTPLYAPFGLTCALFLLCYLASFFSTRMKPLPASLLTGFVGAGSLFIYEHCAEGAGWWFYQNTSMLGNTPYHAIVANFLTAAALPLLAQRVESASILGTLGLGFLIGLWFCVATVLPASLF